MIQAGDFLIPSLDAAIGKKFDVGRHLPARATSAPRPTSAATPSSSPTGSKNKDAAAEFAKFLVTKENMQYFCEKTTVLPVRNDLADAKLAFAARPDLMPVFQKQATTMPEALVKTSTLAGLPRASTRPSSTTWTSSCPTRRPRSTRSSAA